MAECKECVHYSVCQYHIDEETEMTVEECSNFKNKANFVEVIRCKDCECYMPQIPPRGEVPEAGFCIGSFEPVKFVLGTDFCPHGNKKERKVV